MKIKINHFNLIEIVLTVAVIAFGVVVILGMLPKGLRAARNAGIESFATDVIDQMCNYMTYNTSARNDLTTYASASDFPDLKDYDNLNYNALLTGPSNGFSKVNTYDLAAHESVRGLYAIVRGELDSSGDNEAIVDFSGLLYVWKSPAKYAKLQATHKGDDADKKMHDCGKEGCDFERVIVPSTTTEQVNIELSYPLSLPYAERTKRYYSFEVNK